MKEDQCFSLVLLTRDLAETEGRPGIDKKTTTFEAPDAGKRGGREGGNTKEVSPAPCCRESRCPHPEEPIETRGLTRTTGQEDADGRLNEWTI